MKINFGIDRRKRLATLAATLLAVGGLQSLHAQTTQSAPTTGTAPSTAWPVARPESRPYTRWWWLGSAVDEEGLKSSLDAFAKVGIGGVEITPIYGVQGNEANEVPYLRPEWMVLLREAQAAGKASGVAIEMSTGSGWPFGGPWVEPDEGACRLVWDADGNYTVGRTEQKVKRAAPGGEGRVVDHFSREAVDHYLRRFRSAFMGELSEKTLRMLAEATEPIYVTPAHTDVPPVLFCDSYEVYGADWTPALLDEFKSRRGYDLEPYVYILNKPFEERTDGERRIVSDYRETLGELLLENFTQQWTEWAHQRGSQTRCQAHGSPANLIDIYAAVDIPECEGFGLSDFGIKGLRRDEGMTKKNDSDISMLKYASSAAHIAGHPLTSSETFTWLTEHFRTSLSQCKPDLDLMFLSGVNHVYYHGAAYSPKDEPWPGWRFYASVDMSPYNNWWSVLPAFNTYVSRAQSFLQWGEPDNDLLVYLPYYDMLYDQPGSVALFDIHSMGRRAPKFIEAVTTMIRRGYDVDYVSDRYLADTAVTSRYRTIVVPDVRFMPAETLRHLLDYAKAGGQVMFVGSMPGSVPGYGRDAEQQTFAKLKAELQHTATFHPTEAMSIEWGKGRIITSPTYAAGLAYSQARREPMTETGLSCIRRRNDEGYHYFVANLQATDVDQYVELGVKHQRVALYNPMDGSVTQAATDKQGRVRLQLRSGESIIVRTYTTAPATTLPRHVYYAAKPASSTNLTGWDLTFTESAPETIAQTYHIDGDARAWTTLGDAKLDQTMARGVYRTTFSRPALAAGQRALLNLGDVRESARVRINGREVATLFAVPYVVDVTDALAAGKNELEIEVANLPANRIAQMDRDGKEWRRFKEINVVDLNYKKTHYDQWATVPSGLNSPVRIEVHSTSF